MPTYDYECGECKHTFEKFQSIKAPSIRKCPSCGKLAVHRLIGAGAAVIFKGSGFYQTDYRSESYRKAAANDKPSGGDKSSGDSGGASDSAGKSSTDTSSGKSADGASSGDKAAKAKPTGKSK